MSDGTVVSDYMSDALKYVNGKAEKLGQHVKEDNQTQYVQKNYKTYHSISLSVS
jgi:hypothetical protein